MYFVFRQETTKKTIYLSTSKLNVNTAQGKKENSVSFLFQIYNLFQSKVSAVYTSFLTKAENPFSWRNLPSSNVGVSPHTPKCGFVQGKAAMILTQPINSKGGNKSKDKQHSQNDVQPKSITRALPSPFLSCPLSLQQSLTPVLRLSSTHKVLDSLTTRVYSLLPVYVCPPVWERQAPSEGIVFPTASRPVQSIDSNQSHSVDQEED